MGLSTSDYLIKVNGAKLPMRYIAKGSYSADLQPISAGTYTNANGDTKEAYYKHKRLVARFDVSPLTESMLNDFIGFWEFIEGTRDVEVECWVPGEKQYVSQRVKVDGIVPTLDTITRRYDGIFESFKVTLTGRGGA